MTKKKTSAKTKNAAPSTPVAAPTQSDLDLAAGLLPSNRKAPIRSPTTTLIDRYATPGVQEGLTALSAPLASFNGCSDVKFTLALANEGQTLAAAFVRMQSATNSVGQRVVQINQQLQKFDTALNRAQSTAAPGTPVQKGLTDIAKLRGQATSRVKARKTRNKNAKKRASKA